MAATSRHQDDSQTESRDRRHAWRYGPTSGWGVFRPRSFFSDGTPDSGAADSRETAPKNHHGCANASVTQRSRRCPRRNVEGALLAGWRALP